MRETWHDVTIREGGPSNSNWFVVGSHHWWLNHLSTNKQSTHIRSFYHWRWNHSYWLCICRFSYRVVSCRVNEMIDCTLCVCVLNIHPWKNENHLFVKFDPDLDRVLLIQMGCGCDCYWIWIGFRASFVSFVRSLPTDEWIASLLHHCVISGCHVTTSILDIIAKKHSCCFVGFSQTSNGWAETSQQQSNGRLFDYSSVGGDETACHWSNIIDIHPLCAPFGCCSFMDTASSSAVMWLVAWWYFVSIPITLHYTTQYMSANCSFDRSTDQCPPNCSCYWDVRDVTHIQPTTATTSTHTCWWVRILSPFGCSFTDKGFFTYVGWCFYKYIPYCTLWYDTTQYNTSFVLFDRPTSVNQYHFFFIINHTFFITQYEKLTFHCRSFFFSVLFCFVSFLFTILPYYIIDCTVLFGIRWF